jgi:hypothetical protein
VKFKIGSFPASLPPKSLAVWAIAESSMLQEQKVSPENIVFFKKPRLVFMLSLLVIVIWGIFPHFSIVIDIYSILL